MQGAGMYLGGRGMQGCIYGGKGMQGAGVYLGGRGTQGCI